MTCAKTQERMTTVLAGSAGRNDLLDVEEHIRRCNECAHTYRDLIATSVAVARAFAPLRATRVVISPARVRLAARKPQPVPASLRFSRISARVNELALAAAVTAFAFVGAVQVTPRPAIVDEAAPEQAEQSHAAQTPDDQYLFRWIRLGRYAPAADVLDPSVSPRALRDDSPIVIPERSGLAR